MSTPEHRSGGREESRDQQMDRNFSELLQELRVVQTGTQILAGFLLTLPFTSQFTDIGGYHRTIFLVSVVLAFTTTILLIGPVSVHRMLFRKHRKADLVQLSHTLARIGLFTLALTLASVLCLTFSVVVGDVAGWVAAAAAGCLMIMVWWVVPHRLPARDDDTSSSS